MFSSHYIAGFFNCQYSRNKYSQRNLGYSVSFLLMDIHPKETQIKFYQGYAKPCPKCFEIIFQRLEICRFLNKETWRYAFLHKVLPTLYLYGRERLSPNEVKQSSSNEGAQVGEIYIDGTSLGLEKITMHNIYKICIRNCSKYLIHIKACFTVCLNFLLELLCP